jgi:hypothetical protein
MELPQAVVGRSTANPVETTVSGVGESKRAYARRSGRTVE